MLSVPYILLYYTFSHKWYKIGRLVYTFESYVPIDQYTVIVQAILDGACCHLDNTQQYLEEYTHYHFYCVLVLSDSILYMFLIKMNV